jgi:mannan endo-1,4-beta-mannosidase
VSAADSLSPASFIKTSGTEFTVDGRLFFVTGVNNHNVTFESQEEVIRVFDDAVATGVNVVRIFLQPVIGSLDGSTATIWNWRLEADASDLAVKGTYLLCWDPIQTGWRSMTAPTACRRLISSSPRPASNASGSSSPGFLGLHGGRPADAGSFGSRDESTFFFGDPRTKRDYRAWVRHVVQRVIRARS